MSVAASGQAALAASAPEAGPPASDDSALSANRPFLGLRPFGFADRAFFFGRERQVFALYRLVENARFIAVIGSSGSGKSSLVLAGLSGLLADESADPGGPNWACFDMRPGAAPLNRLAKTLARLAVNDSPDDAARRRERIEYRLRQSSFSLESALEEAGGLGGRSLLLIIDQFEELFRFGLAGLGLKRPGIEEARARDEATLFVQILLDADRRRLKDVHVLITMRSDFIGDCAYFHGLPEAVSATQFLAPNLTRSQLEDAIRKPIEKAGGTIEPELVERLINDCGDEPDQLPVLQHCLMRLWDRAGVASAEGPRRLTRQTYDDVGRMTESLSRHADEILRRCAGKELAVEQAFRALSEFDREGRAIRRALRFDKLLAETGVSEADLRAALDSFRAPTCSFLVPPSSVAPTLAPDDRVDIGHETLLRRWKKLAGVTEIAEAAAGRSAKGWLGVERADGERYRTLASLVGGETGGEKAELTDPEGTKRWWESLPRTAAWADRYGGNFEGVRKLIAGAIAAKRRERLKRNAIVAGLAVVVAAAAVGGLVLRQAYVEASQKAIDVGAMGSAKTMLERVLKAYNDQTLNLAGAKSLAEVSENFLDDIRRSQQSAAADSLWAEALGAESDLQATSRNYDKALALAIKEKETALPLVKANPKSRDTKQLAYDATIRLGALFSSDEFKRFDEALRAFEDAKGVAQDIVALSGDEASEVDLVNAELKIGDIPHIRRQEDDALTDYRAALSDCEKALGRFPQSDALLQYKANTYYRIAEAERLAGSLEEAKSAYQSAMSIQQALVQRKPGDPDLKSNLAATYIQRGTLEEKEGDLAAALSDFQSGVKPDEELLEGDPTNPRWEAYLAPHYKTIGDILQALNRPTDALAYYEKCLDARRDLALRDRRNATAQEDLADAAKIVGDHGSGLARIDAYRTALRAWKRLLEEAKAASAAAAHFDDLMNFGPAFDAAQDSPDARAAYAAAEKIARMNLAKDPSDKSWQDKADAAAKALAAAAGLSAEPAAEVPQP
jgi:tetratricopeptide (TPR) repeat protein